MSLLPWNKPGLSRLEREAVKCACAIDWGYRARYYGRKLRRINRILRAQAGAAGGHQMDGPDQEEDR